MFIDTRKITTPVEPFYNILFIEQTEEVIGCVRDNNYTCKFCKMKLLCKVRDENV
jgi:hypothetical protein